MAKVTGGSQFLSEINLEPSTEFEEVLRNVSIILDSIQYQVPMNRDFGLPSESLGRPMNVVKNQIISAIYDQIEQYEPRAIIGGVDFKVDEATGTMFPVVDITGVKEDE